MKGVFIAMYVVAGLTGMAMHLLIVERLKRKHRESWIELGSPRYFAKSRETKYQEFRRHGVHRRLGDHRLSFMVSIANICLILVIIMTISIAAYGIVGAFQKYS